MKIIENFEQFKYEYNFYSIQDLVKIKDKIEKLLKIKHDKDIFNIEFYNVSVDETVICENNITVLDFDSLFKSIDDDNDDEFELRITIKKNNFTIYSVEKFLEHLSKLELKHIINNFKTFTETPPESLYIAESETHLYSTLFAGAENKVNRERYIALMGNSVNTFGFPSHTLIPNDFEFRYGALPKENKNLFKFLKHLQGLFSVFYLCDFIELEKNKITIKINNTYTFRAQIDFSNFTFSSYKVVDEIYKVYQWVYENNNNENIQDKLELARIQLAKNLSFKENCFEIKAENIISNLQSMYKIYLKENVDKYIEATNKVAEIISDMTFRQNEITSAFTKSLKTNSTLLIGFFISLVVYNNLAAGETSIFNNSNFLLVTLFTLISCISLWLSYRQVNRNLDRSVDYYKKQKEIYEHLFSKDDIKMLFSNDYIKKMKDNVETDRDLYTKVWIFELIVIFITSFVATYCPININKLIELVNQLLNKIYNCIVSI